MKTILAALAGGFVLFLWGFAAHMFLPIGNMGMKYGSGDETALVAAMQERFTQGEGVYFVPSMEMTDYEDEGRMAAWGEKAKKGPYAVVMYSPNGVSGDPAKMMPQLPYEFLTNVLASLLAAVLIASVSGSYFKRVGWITALGVFAWLVVQVPQWNWYQFPLDFTIGGLLLHAIGWFLGGLVIAKLIKASA